MIFNGTLIQLKNAVTQLDIPCYWQHKGVYEMAVFEDGISNLKLNWWPATGELRLVGDPEVRNSVEEKLCQLLKHHT
jgi:hypothetical protein